MFDRLMKKHHLLRSLSLRRCDLALPGLTPKIAGALHPVLFDPP